LSAPVELGTLVGRARAGDAEAFAQLVRTHYRAAFAVALAILRIPADAEDIAQDSFIAAFEQLEHCQQPERFSGWLLRIVRNRALNAHTRRVVGAAAVRFAAIGEEGPPALAGTHLRERLLAALERASPTQREVLLLHDLDGWTHAEIAAALEISEVMSRQHLFQARRVMRALLEEANDRKEVANGHKR
jgi:RNA polymerase sigma-70 factor, ECF subfamily